MEGARVVQAEVLRKLESTERLKVHVVWTPVMATDNLAAAMHSRDIITDGRATHYWDADQSLGKTYTRFVELPEGNDTLAWDIYFVYEPGSRWGEADAPAPADWWHQLSFGDRYLADGDGLRAALQSAAGE